MARKGSRERTLAILAAVPKAIRDEVRKAVEAEAAAVVAMQKRLAPRASGKLAKSIRYTMGDVERSSSANLVVGGKGDPDLTATVVAGDREAYYARFVEFGTAPHRIEPKDRHGSLAIAGNVLAPGESVEHPGAAAQPFFYGPFRARKKTTKRRVSAAVGKAVKKAAQTP